VDLASVADSEALEFMKLPKAAQRRAVRFLQMHVMDNVRQRIEAGHKDFINEIRVCTLLFMGFPSLKVPPPPRVSSSHPQPVTLPSVSRGT